MLSVKIVLDSEKIQADGKYKEENILFSVEDAFLKKGILKAPEGFFVGQGSSHDVANAILTPSKVVKKDIGER